MDTEAVAVLKKARALLAKRGGWIQHKERDSHGGFCAYGAMEEHSTTRGLRKAVAFLVKAIRVPSDIALEHWIADWNDHPRRTKRQVLNAFTKAIKLAKAAKRAK